MQTQSHLLLAAAAIAPLRRWPVSIHVPALLIGAVLPDVALFLLSIGGGLYYRWLAPLPPAMSVNRYLYDTLFFTDPFWIANHNFFHSLVINGALLLAALWWWQRRNSRWGMGLFWLAASMLVHTGIDIVTHSTDGPLIWFPLNWSYRFPSPVSYWEAAYYGREFRIFERVFDLALIGYLALTYWPAVQQRWKSRGRGDQW